MIPLLEGVRFCFGDTSFFYASLDSRDRDHGEARELAAAIQERGIAVVTTWEVVVETVTLLRYRYSHRGAVVFIETVLPGLNLVFPSSSERSEALQVFIRRGSERRVSLCDCLSYAVVRRLGFPPCLAFDDDFGSLGLTVLRAR